MRNESLAMDEKGERGAAFRSGADLRSAPPARVNPRRGSCPRSRLLLALERGKDVGRAEGQQAIQELMA
jgi:hypothetical protein